MLSFIRDNGMLLSPSVVIPAVLTALVAKMVMGMTKKLETSQKNDETNTLQSPPLGFDSFWDFFVTLNSPDAPHILLDKARSIAAPVLRVSMPFSSNDLYIVNDFNVARRILEDPEGTKWNATNKFFNDTMGGENLITAEGRRWKHVRKSTMPAFATHNVKKMVKSIDIIMDQWIQKSLEPAIASGDGIHINILEEMNKVTADIIAEVAFDYKLSDEERVLFLKNLRTCFVEYAFKTSKSVLRQIPYMRFLSSGMRDGKRASEALRKHCKTMLEAYRTKVANDPSARQPHKLIDMLMNDTEYANEEERVRDMLTYAIAGFDTTANTISFALLELGRSPEEQRKLREALQKKYKTEEETRTSPELKHVVREILRLRPAAIVSIRLPGSDIKVQVKDENDQAQSIILPSGSATMLSYFTLQRDAKVFENPDAFMPSRWENPSDDMNKSVLTFSLGKRNCQGQALAYAEMTEILLKLCRDYEINVVNEGRAVNLVLYKPEGAVLSFTKASTP